MSNHARRYQRQYHRPPQTRIEPPCWVCDLYETIHLLTCADCKPDRTSSENVERPGAETPSPSDHVPSAGSDQCIER